MRQKQEKAEGPPEHQHDHQHFHINPSTSLSSSSSYGSTAVQIEQSNNLEIMLGAITEAERQRVMQELHRKNTPTPAPNTAASSSDVPTVAAARPTVQRERSVHFGEGTNLNNHRAASPSQSQPSAFPTPVETVDDVDYGYDELSIGLDSDLVQKASEDAHSQFTNEDEKSHISHVSHMTFGSAVERMSKYLPKHHTRHHRRTSMGAMPHHIHSSTAARSRQRAKEQHKEGKDHPTATAMDAYDCGNLSQNGGHHEAQFNEIVRLDCERAALINMVEEPNMFKVLYHFKGTIWNEVMYDFCFWLVLTFYFALRIYERCFVNYEIREALGQTEAGVLDSLPIVGGFLTLFLVFNVNQEHTRYFALHEDTMFIMGRICDLSSLMVTSLPIDRARRINRYCNAAHIIMYAGLSEHLKKGKIIHNLTRDYALLTYEETKRLESIGLYDGKTSACFELIAWGLFEVNRALREKKIDAFQAFEMREKMVQFRATIAKIFVTSLQPIPFFYIHFLSLLTAIYLPLFALMVSFRTSSYEQVPWYAEIVGFFLVLLQTLFVVGLRMLGQQLGNPYGEDFIDLQLITYITMVLTTTMRILESADNVTLQTIDHTTEEELRQRMVPIGDGYEITPPKHHHHRRSKKGGSHSSHTIRSNGSHTIRSNGSSKSQHSSNANSNRQHKKFSNSTGPSEDEHDLFDYQKLGSTEEEEDTGDNSTNKSNSDDDEHDLRMIRQASVKFTRMDTRTKDWFAENAGSEVSSSSGADDDDDDDDDFHDASSQPIPSPIAARHHAKSKFTRMDTRTKDWFAKHAGPPTHHDNASSSSSSSSDGDYERDMRLIRQASVKFNDMDARSKQWLMDHGGEGGGGAGKTASSDRRLGLDRTHSSTDSVVSEEIIFEHE